jgi:hypothetical protein
MAGTVSIPTDLWRTPDFVALPPGAQWLYLMLLTQPETNPCGLLALRPTRWATLCGDGNANEISRDLGVLEVAGHWAGVDFETDEVVLRRHLRVSGVRQIHATLSAVDEIRSHRLRLQAIKDVLASAEARAQSADPNSPTARLRLSVYTRDDFRCQACSWRVSPPADYDGRSALGDVFYSYDEGRYKFRVLELDHVHPKSRGGKLTIANVQTLCNTCNARKGASV